MSTESPISITYSLLDPNGFPILLTFRSDDPKILMSELLEKSNWLKGHNYLPQVKKSFGGGEKKPEVVVGKCPDCNGDLLEKTTGNGKKFHECRNRKYNFQTKQEMGTCKYIKWL